MNAVLDHHGPTLRVRTLCIILGRFTIRLVWRHTSSRKNDRDPPLRRWQAKSRLARLKEVTIPRIELMAATLATRQDELLRKELDITQDR